MALEQRVVFANGENPQLRRGDRVRHCFTRLRRGGGVTTADDHKDGNVNARKPRGHVQMEHRQGAAVADARRRQELVTRRQIQLTAGLPPIERTFRVLHVEQTFVIAEPVRQAIDS